jgi:hypothetical protein
MYFTLFLTTNEFFAFSTENDTRIHQQLSSLTEQIIYYAEKCLSTLRISNRSPTISLMTEATRIQALYRGWSTRQLISTSKDHVDEHCNQIENLIQQQFHEYGHSLLQSNNAR